MGTSRPCNGAAAVKLINQHQSEHDCKTCMIPSHEFNIDHHWLEPHLLMAARRAELTGPVHAAF